eukprot:TRINITY_DN12891_c0_g1_i1.p1 TRINITY_DN12891_c0_g1~~TRINITY_DN12891_c0_g1_i1.p1  ORF type:complete len:200 (-),score=31.44 TRINITY_DN12891_c0_g1_i1:144-743(-)
MRSTALFAVFLLFFAIVQSQTPGNCPHEKPGTPLEDCNSCMKYEGCEWCLSPSGNNQHICGPVGGLKCLGTGVVSAGSCPVNTNATSTMVGHSHSRTPIGLIVAILTGISVFSMCLGCLCAIRRRKKQQLRRQQMMAQPTFGQNVDMEGRQVVYIPLENWNGSSTVPVFSPYMINQTWNGVPAQNGQESVPPMYPAFQE